MIDKDEIIRCLRALTIDRESFDGAPWSLDDAETLEMIAASVRSAIGEKAAIARAWERVLEGI